MEGKACCVTGHRDIPADQVEYVKHELNKEIENAIAEGYTRFISGFAEGVDQYFAEIVAQKMETNESIRLEAALPYRSRYFKLMEDDHTKDLLAACTDLSIISEKYAPNVYMVRNRYMVKCADRVIAVYDGRDKGGTVSTIRLAHIQRKQIREIPLGLKLTPTEQ